MTGREPLGARRLLSWAWRTAVVAAVIASTTLLIIDLIAAPRALLWDFKGDLYGALTAILHGRNPYRAGYVAHLAALKRANPGLNVGFAVPTKPAPILLAFLPLGLLPAGLSGAIFVLLCIAATVIALRLLGVRDWRCYALALASWPSLYGLWLGNSTALLFLGCACVWRYRERVLAPALATATTVLMKLFPWPLAVWLLITRRWRAFAAAVAIGAAATIVGWAAIGFAGMAAYPHMLSNLSFDIQGNGPSFMSLLMALGLGAAVAQPVVVGAGLTLLAAARRIWQRGDDQAERRSFGLAVMAALIAAPNIWEHYLLLMFIPIALLSPALSAIWFVPLLSAEIPTVSPGNTSQMLYWVALQSTVIVWLAWPQLHAIVRVQFGSDPTRRPRSLRRRRSLDARERVIAG